MSKSLEDYEKLQELGKEIRTLSGVAMLLEWDQETYMPKGGITSRSEQVELISFLIHEKKTSATFKKALEKLIDLESGELKGEDLSNRKKRSVEEFYGEYIKDAKLPADFVKKLAKANSKGTHAWQKAREENSFEAFLPYLENIVTLNQQKAAYLGFKDHPYDALLDLYEPGVTTQELDTLFGTLKPFLTDLTKKLAAKKKVSTAFLTAQFPRDKQMEFCHFLLDKMKLDPEKFRLDFSTHPFCTAPHPHDVRLTTHTSSSGFFKNISAVMHEGGHALYELGLPVEDFGTPLAEYCTMGIHESQSRWWECFIGQGRPFWEFAYPKLLEIFPEQLQGITLDHFYQAINQVEPSLIRVFADEVTYILHIILRYEIEKEFIAGTLNLADLPHIWNEKMENSLGVTPDTDMNGCLQDVHWSCGLIGYFPTYALGNIYASQFFDTFQKTFPDWEMRTTNGDLAFIRHFLLEKVHRHGREFPALTLIERATGAPLSPQPYMDYLTKKYSQ
ncbi:carboxypeptidase M32 [Candidatus Neptunochlamydia vexilliferae]|uniref:Metal-dependent carboxypeptidase n=1 Tax=Candidatus Neptunichlamydia vexilliferae TaxID=1651774 RepID=A0ABS0AZF7_9BACT|nr:carboxypeptidase M32 [Candidatus Neptunochlamydia vexilliferae]MBF5059518.1 Carboxypeptidase 1 [Candidatus Neptunochlamydia vexilliferae]